MHAVSRGFASRYRAVSQLSSSVGEPLMNSIKMWKPVDWWWFCWCMTSKSGWSCALPTPGCLLPSEHCAQPRNHNQIQSAQPATAQIENGTTLLLLLFFFFIIILPLPSSAALATYAVLQVHPSFN